MRAKSRTTLFLMEMIMAVFFFAVTSAICAQVFAKAHSVSIHTTELNEAIVHAESMAEIFRSGEGTTDVPSELFYDAHWKDCSKEASAYKLILRQEDEANLRKARISVIRQVSGETIYSMDVYKHPRLEAAYE